MDVLSLNGKRNVISPQDLTCFLLQYLYSGSALPPYPHCPWQDHLHLCPSCFWSVPWESQCEWVGQSAAPCGPPLGLVGHCEHHPLPGCVVWLRVPINAVNIMHTLISEDDLNYKVTKKLLIPMCTPFTLLKNIKTIRSPTRHVSALQRHVFFKSGFSLTSLLTKTNNDCSRQYFYT